MTVKSYRDLKVWEASMELVAEKYELAARFPTQERYGLRSQVQRSAVSIPSNIAEGHARQSTKEYLRFISIALGSLAELETQMILAERLALIESAHLTDFLSKAGVLGKMLRRLQQALYRKFPSPQSPAPSPQPRSGSSDNA